MKHVRFLIPFALGFAVLAETGAAQSTWIVDSSNGPGTHFTDLQVAVDTVAAGDTLLIRQGNGYPKAIVTKGLRFVDDAPINRVSSIGELYLVGIPKGQSFSSTGFWFGNGVAIFGCRGAIHLEGCYYGASSTSISNVLHGDLVTFRYCSLGLTDRSWPIENSTVVFQQCAIGIGLSGTPGAFGTPNVYPPTIQTKNSRLHFLATIIRGGAVAFNAQCATLVAPGVAIDATDSEITVGPLARVEGGIYIWNFCQTRYTSPAITGTRSTIRIDPRAFSQRTTTQGSTLQVVHEVVPSAQALEAHRGGAVPVKTYGDPNSPVVVVAGLPTASPLAVPGIGDFWIDPAVILTVDVGTLDALGERVSSVPVPNALPQGMAIVFQSLEWASSGPRLTWPSVTAVR